MFKRQRRERALSHNAHHNCCRYLVAAEHSRHDVLRRLPKRTSFAHFATRLKRHHHSHMVSANKQRLPCARFQTLHEVTNRRRVHIGLRWRRRSQYVHFPNDHRCKRKPTNPDDQLSIHDYRKKHRWNKPEFKPAYRSYSLSTFRKLVSN